MAKISDWIKRISTVEARYNVKLPLIESKLKAGFPSPADDFSEHSIDLNELLIRHPKQTYLIQTSGDSMIGIGIFEDDILVVDTSLTAINGDIVVASVGGEFTLKRLKLVEGQPYLMPENPRYAPIEITEEMDLSIWGVVTNVIHPIRGGNLTLS
ncbi:MAG TPA: translesion error-prone DNA polymerase V autoproteolytic subunit [Caldisericia bacterium]|nr:translesion error-prone DNA polymerase V autoproteolytic subunit [Caldisericia bacterium]HRV75182.1 translesion error-prone DNA polymerase V autoproteolytic subunit [Caldisericia bacterium]